jgi:hypothetical protein
MKNDWSLDCHWASRLPAFVVFAFAAEEAMHSGFGMLAMNPPKPFVNFGFGAPELERTRLCLTNLIGSIPRMSTFINSANGKSWNDWPMGKKVSASRIEGQTI